MTFFNRQPNMSPVNSRVSRYNKFTVKELEISKAASGFQHLMFNLPLFSNKYKTLQSTPEPPFNLESLGSNM